MLKRKFIRVGETPVEKEAERKVQAAEEVKEDPGFRVYSLQVGESDGQDANIDVGFRVYALDEPGVNVHYTAVPGEGESALGRDVTPAENRLRGDTGDDPDDPPGPVVVSPGGAHHFQSLHQFHKTGSGSGFDPEHAPNMGATHKKSSLEKDGENLLRNKPIPWNPEPNGEAIPPRAPPAPEQDDDDFEAGKVYCKSNDGRWGGDNAKNQGVIIRYQYELTQSAEYDANEDLKNDILPAVETGITDHLLPVFFDMECMSSLKREEDSAGGGGGEAVFVDRRFLRSGGDHKVMGIDSLPEDFVRALQTCTPTTQPPPNSSCHTMEGALTLFFPPNYSIQQLVQGAHLETLNSLREGMALGDIVKRVNHPGLLRLSFLESSYSLAPEIPSDGIVMDEGDKPTNVGGVVAGILVPLLLLCCCGCLVVWRKRGAGGVLMLRRSQSSSSVEGEGDSSEESSHLRKPKKIKSKRKKKRSLRSRSMSSRSSQSSRSISGGSYNDDSSGNESDASLEMSGEINAIRRRSSRRSKKSKKVKKKKSKKSSQEDDEVWGVGDSMQSSQRSSMHSSHESIGEESDSSSPYTDEPSAASSYIDDSTTTTSDPGNTEGSTTTNTSSSIATNRETSTTSTSGEDDNSTTSSNNSTTTSTESDNDSTDSTTSSDEEEQGEDQFGALEGWVRHRENAREVMQDSRKRQGVGATSRPKATTSLNNNLIMTGTADDDNNSVMTGVTGIHSVCSQATAQVKNTTGATSIPSGVHSVSSQVTAQVKNSRRGGGGAGTFSDF